MKFTGERPTFENELISSRLRYKSILPYCINKKILDFGCGVGLGSYFLSHFCEYVFGFDQSFEAISEARTEFHKDNLKFVIDMLECLTSIDLIVSVEVIEHLEKEALHNKIKLFASYCDFVCTTPNGNLLHYQPLNVNERRGYHVWHYTEQELRDLFNLYYKFVDISGHAYDPKLNAFTGYTIVCSNKLNWDNAWMTTIKI